MTRARGEGRIVVDVVTAIADAEDADPAELEFTLADWIDTDALEALFANGTGDRLEVSFTVRDHRVTVDSDGAVTVDGRT